LRKIIFHIDVNSAFLSWEAVYRLCHKGGTVDLREIPSAVAGDVAMRHGIILAKSIPAKKYGIQTGESIPEAKKKCPQLVLVPPNYSLYERCSAAFMAILREYSDAVEQYSIDEAFMDMTETCHLFGEPEQTACIIKDRIFSELGFTVNVGVSENKLLAKMASDFKKPDRVHSSCYLRKLFLGEHADAVAVIKETAILKNKAGRLQGKRQAGFILGIKIFRIYFCQVGVTIPGGKKIKV